MELNDDGGDNGDDAWQELLRESVDEHAISEVTVAMLGLIVEHMKTANLTAEIVGEP